MKSDPVQPSCRDEAMLQRCYDWVCNGYYRDTRASRFTGVVSTSTKAQEV